MKTNANHLLFTVATACVLILLASCEGGTIRTWEINNSSAQTVHVQAEVILNGALVDTIIQSGVTAEITWWEQRGGSGRVEPPTEEFSQLIITNPQLDTAAIVWQDIGNWQVQTTHVSRAPSSWEHTHLLVVTDSLFL
jgi:hypothetical protein